MRYLLRASTPLLVPCMAAGCNALFDVEEPVIVEVPVEGGAAGSGGSTLSEGGEGAAATSSGGAGGSSDTPGPEGGSAGEPELGVAGREGGSGGVAEPPETPTTGGRSPDSGGATSTGGTLGIGGEVSASGGSPDPEGAAGAAGGAVCAEGSSRCLDTRQLEVCEGGAVRTAICDHGCMNDECAACDEEAVECSPDKKSVRVCGADGQFGPATTCIDKTCVPESGCEGECAPGQVRCNPLDGDAETCTAGQWTLEDECISQVERCVIESGESICIDNDVFPLGPEQALIGGSLESQTPNFLLLYPLPQVEETAVVAEMGLVGDGMPAYAQLVLYEDDGNGYPGTRLAHTSTLDVESPGPNTMLPSDVVLLDPEKHYWIGVVFASDGSPQLHCRTKTGAPTSYERSLTFNAAFPVQLPAGAVPIFDRECNLFLRVRTQTP